MLVKYYNIIIVKGFYPSQWIKILDVMLEKGKGLVLGNLKTIQLIEANFQLIIRVFITLRNQQAIENNRRLSKFNFRS